MPREIFRELAVGHFFSLSYQTKIADDFFHHSLRALHDGP
jgi:hypothetical protein